MDYRNLISRTAVNLKPSGIRRFFSVANEIEGVVSLGVGEPDFKTPWLIRKAGIESLDRGQTWYTANAGLPRLQQEISKYLDRRFGMCYDPAQILITVGGSEAIDISMRALLNPGDEVLLPQPSFVCYAPIAELIGAKVVPIVTREDDDFRLTARALREAITPRTKLLVLPFPNNPTGGVMRRGDLEAIAQVLRGTDIVVLSDEIYAELTYEGERHVSIAQIEGMRERTIVASGFSKAYAMTGWRLGYVVAPEPIMEVLYKIHQYAVMCAPTTSQYAAIEAMRSCDDEIEKMATEYTLRRRYVVDRLNKMGLHCFTPQGAFYAFPSIQSTGMKSLEFCERLLYGKKVAVVPGDAFGESGEGFVRICYCYSMEHLRTALERIQEFLHELQG